MTNLTEIMHINVNTKASFERKLVQLNKRAVKLDMPPVTAEYGGSQEVPSSQDVIGAYYSRGKWMVMSQEVILRGEAPVLSGYEFCAVIDLTANVLVKEVPFQQHDVAQFHSADDLHICDHCNTNRRRNKMLVFADQAGELMKVGMNCAEDFLRSKSAVKSLFVSDWITELREVSDNPMGGYYSDDAPLTAVMEMTCAVVRENGWVPASDDYKTPTKMEVHKQLFPWTSKQQRIEITDADQKLAAKVIEWFRGEFVLQDRYDNFGLNIKSLLGDEINPMIPMKAVGMVVWAVNGFKKAQAAEIKRQKAAERPSQHVGEVGKRMVMDVTVVAHNVSESDFGVTHRFNFVDAQGNEIVWFGTGKAANALTELVGQEVSIKATVKKHGEFRDMPNTTITRVALA